MASKRREPPDGPGHALWEYIVELEHSKEYYPWYRRASARHKWAWGLGQATTLLAGVLASILAAVASNQALARFGLLRIALIVLPVVGAARADPRAGAARPARARGDEGAHRQSHSGVYSCGDRSRAPVRASRRPRR